MQTIKAGSPSPELVDENVLPENMKPSEASRYTCIPQSTLAKLRMSANRGRGPRFVKLSGTVIYRRSDLDAWIEKNVVEATT
ncbi:helix-turn-helix transcriptional regulator [Silicimonas algicola]|nr:helix-turn-helix domain-containing protein [Silicimonas algicola]